MQSEQEIMADVGRKFLRWTEVQDEADRILKAPDLVNDPNGVRYILAAREAHEAACALEAARQFACGELRYERIH